MVSRDTARDVEADLADEIATYYADPLGYVMFNFPWDADRSIQLVKLKEPWRSRYGCEYGPDEWACKFLEDVGKDVENSGFDGKNAVDPLRYSTASGHGIGKSVLVAWLVMWLMDTRPYCRGTVTAMTAEQLKGKTWAEVGKWHRMALTSHLYTYQNTRGAMSIRRKGYEQEWFCQAQTCKEENSEAFAGQHAANSTSFYIFDEASGISEKIFQVREGGLTDGEPMVFDFGNPTRNSGPFYDNCVGKFRHRYKVRTIDSRTVAISSKNNLHSQWIEDYGIESDFVKVRVLGQFPSASDLQFIHEEEVKLAQARELIRLDSSHKLVLGVDVARHGSDESVILPRIGPDARSWAAKRYRQLDTVQLTGKVVEMVRFFRELGRPVSMIYVDVAGVGGGVVDQLTALGYPVLGVNFGSKPINTQMYRYRGDEMWGNIREACKKDLILPTEYMPNGSDLRQQLISREFGYTLNGHKISLESKEEMKKRGLSSPDIADALALTYALPMAAIDTPPMMGHNGGPSMNDDYDPHKDAGDW